MNVLTCPICQQSNNCSVNNNATQCWCMNIKIDEHVYEKIEQQFPNDQCICQACLKKMHIALHENL